MVSKWLTILSKEVSTYNKPLDGHGGIVTAKCSIYILKSKHTNQQQQQQKKLQVYWASVHLSLLNYTELPMWEAYWPHINAYCVRSHAPSQNPPTPQQTWSGKILEATKRRVLMGWQILASSFLGMWHQMKRASLTKVMFPSRGHLASIYWSM